ncbi:MAG: glycosyltransferase family 4 protein [Bacteroidota bacterium]|nr:glycosyltransferase family 4 protein [Bacteroidota bacterium]
MRVLFVSHSFPPADRPMASVGGMQRVAVDLSDHLKCQPGIEARDIVLRSSWRFHHVRCAPWLVWTLIRLQTMARRGVMDAVLFSSMVTGALAPLLRPTFKAAGIPMAAIAHGRDVTLPGLHQLMVIRRALRGLDAVMPVSRATARACQERGMPTRRIHVVPNGVDSERFTLGGGSEDGQLRLLSVGRLVRRKGFAWFVENVMPRLPSGVNYRIVGDGPEKEKIARVIRRSGLQSRVSMLGQLTDGELVQSFQMSDLLVMPNRPVAGDMEGFGVVMLEAGACGMPTVAADLEGIRDVITPGRNGVLVRQGNAAAFAEAIQTTRSDAAVRSRVRDHTVSTFSWDRIAARFVDHLERLQPGRTVNQDRGAAR